MLIRFTVENFRSFNGEAVFSMLPGRVQKHNKHIVSHPKQDIDALRIAVIYGANGSGKSNLVKAMNFAQRFVIDGTRPKQRVPVEPYRLDRSRLTQPSRFEFEFAVNEHIYAYGFLVDARSVHEEWLYAVDSNREYPLFERKTVNNKVDASFSDEVTTNDRTEKLFLEFVTRGTRPNELLLTKLDDSNVDYFEPIYEWFRDTLTIVFPNSQFNGVQMGVHKDQKFSQELASFLHSMGTGIDEVCMKTVEAESIDFPMDLVVGDLDARNEVIDEGDDEDASTNRLIVLNSPNGRYLLQRTEDGLLETHALGTRRYVGGDPVDFELSEESDGTQRLFDLFPVLYGAKIKVFVIDELERSLHPNLVRRFIGNFLGAENQNQLIVTTHEATLLDLALLRRDEIWFVEKSPSGSSIVYSLEEFKPRHDLDVRKGYLQGRFGAIPVFGSSLHFDQVEA